MRILLVDDDDAYLDSMSTLLKSYGHNAVVALDGSAALHLANCKICDLVITDFRMPDIEGIELFKKIRRLKPAIAGILVSAEMTDTRKKEAVEAGMSGGFDKLLEIDNLLSFISEMTKNLD